MKKLPLGFLLVLWLATGALAQEAPTPTQGQNMTFGDALETMHRQNKKLSAAKKEVEEMAYEQKAAWGLRLPTVTASALFVKLDEDVALDFSEHIDGLKSGLGQLTPEAIQKAVAGGAITPDQAKGIKTLTDGLSGVKTLMGSNLHLPTALTLQEQSFSAVNATLMMPIYTGGKINVANKAAELRHHEASEELRKVKGELLEELVQRYFGLRLAESVVQIRQDVLEGVGQHLNDARKLEENGMIAEAQRLYAEMAHSEANRELKKAEHRLELTRTALGNTLATKGQVVPITELFYTDNIESLEHFHEMAEQYSPLIRQLDSKVELAHQKFVKERSEFLPTVFVTGNKELYQNDLLAGLSPSWMVGAGVKWKIFDGLKRYNKMKAARKLEERASDLNQKYSEDVRTGVEKHYRELKQALEQLTSIESSMKFASEYLRVKEKAFKAGMAESTSVVDARLNLSKVEVERIKAMYDYDLALAKLLSLSGRSELFLDYMAR
ncbi:membrane protein [Fulvitalea axinellae]|uniref:Membrane protein n=1 Tax=Fulvitalea axinellae TaxID=1182444 RepID=A0AAU9CUF2_9BACT|nr:membrane protein [Fulvitalea axinellae]